MVQPQRGQRRVGYAVQEVGREPQRERKRVDEPRRSAVAYQWWSVEEARAKPKQYAAPTMADAQQQQQTEPENCWCSTSRTS